MNTDKHVAEVERMAREAGCFEPNASRNHWAVTGPALARFAALVRADALEQAAKVCDSVDNYANPMTANDCAAAIRALP